MRHHAMITLITAAFVLALSPAVAVAHPGGVDASGCHTNRKTGAYHCHGSRSRLSLPEPDRVTHETHQRPDPEACVGSLFGERSNARYSYCRVEGGYAIKKDGKRTGTAKPGSAAYDSIRSLEPKPIVVQPVPPPVKAEPFRFWTMGRAAVLLVVLVVVAGALSLLRKS